MQFSFVLPCGRWFAVDKNAFEWAELGRLTARRDELQNERDTTPQGRVGLRELIDGEIRKIEEQRKRLIAHLTGEFSRRAEG